jgi:hypothetical protein
MPAGLPRAEALRDDVPRAALPRGEALRAAGLRAETDERAADLGTLRDRSVGRAADFLLGALLRASVCAAFGRAAIGFFIDFPL